MPVDYKRMRNRINLEAIDEQRRANQTVFNLERKYVLEATPPPPSPSLMTIASSSLKGSQLLSALLDTINTFQNLSIYDYLNTSIPTLVNLRKEMIDYINNLQYVILPSVQTTGDRTLLINLSNETNNILKNIKILDDSVNSVITDMGLLQSELLDVNTKNRYKYDALDLGKILANKKITVDEALIRIETNERVLESEAKSFDELQNKYEILIRSISSLNAPSWGNLPYVDKEFERSLSKEVANIPMEEENYDDYESELEGEGKYVPKSMFVEDNDFYVPEEETDEEEEKEMIKEEKKGGIRAVKPSNDIKIAYGGQGINQKSYNMGRNKVMLMNNPVYDPIGQQLRDLKGGEKKYIEETTNDKLRFKLRRK